MKPSPVSHRVHVSMKAVYGRATANKDKRGMALNVIKYSKIGFGII